MNEEKLKKAELLLSEIGEIDDELLCEAVSYRKRRVFSSKALAIAATLTLVFCLTVGISLMDKLPEKNEGEKPQDGEPEYKLENVFTSLDKTDRFDYVSDSDSLPYFDGNAHIVWQYKSDDGYYVSDELKSGQLSSVKSGLGKGPAVGESSPSLDVKVWILLGDGRVISPYLELSRGNISSEIFDYEAELLPDEGFAKKIQSILN